MAVFTTTSTLILYADPSGRCYVIWAGKIYIKEKFTYGDECSWQEEQGYDRDDLHRDGLNLCFPCNIVHICGH